MTICLISKILADPRQFILACKEQDESISRLTLQVVFCKCTQFQSEIREFTSRFSYQMLRIVRDMNCSDHTTES